MHFFRDSHLRFRRTILTGLMLALALAQTLGLVHRIVHSPLALHAAASPSALSAQPVPHGLQALFAGHRTEQGCDLYDQLSHFDWVHVDIAAVPLLLHWADTPDSLHPTWHLAAQAAGFLARGPPRKS